MKKTLLLAAAMVACISASAQVEFANLDATKAGALTAGDVVAKTDNVTMSVAFDDSYVNTDSKGKAITVNGPKNSETNNNYRFFFVGNQKINDDDLTIQGSQNPKDGTGSTKFASLATPAAGAVYQFVAKEDGYIYVLFKASSNKAYAVYEEEAPIGYVFSELTDAGLMGYTLKTKYTEDDDNYPQLNPTDYPNGIYWPEQIVNNWDGTSDWTALKKNGCAVVKFQVAKDLKYWFNAWGSKAIVRAFAFDTTGDADVYVSDDADGNNKTQILAKGENVPSTTGISSIKTNDAQKVNANAPIYNLAGQQVTKAYKGIVIQNGHKFFNVK